MVDLKQVGRMTIKEYSLRMKAYRLKHVDELYTLHLQAWLNSKLVLDEQDLICAAHMVYGWMPTIWRGCARGFPPCIN